MNEISTKFAKAISAFDAYNSKDPNVEKFEGKTFPKEILYAQRMSDRLAHFAPDAKESIKLAARSQHIGRWEIARANYPMDKKGYLIWRNEEKIHQSKVAEGILTECGYDAETISRVKSLLLKKELRTNADTQLLEDVVCLVFIEYYLEDFASKHESEKVIDIIRKTAKKMSPAAVKAVSQLNLSGAMQSLLAKSL